MIFDFVDHGSVRVRIGFHQRIAFSRAGQVGNLPLRINVSTVFRQWTDPDTLTPHMISTVGAGF